MFHARDKNSLDLGLGGPKDHVVCFVLNSEAFGPKTAPPNVNKWFDIEIVSVIIYSVYTKTNFRVQWMYNTNLHRRSLDNYEEIVFFKSILQNM